MNKSKIKSVKARTIWAANGYQTVEVEIGLRYGAQGRARSRLPTIHVPRTTDLKLCVDWINRDVNRALKGLSAEVQETVDSRLGELSALRQDVSLSPYAVNALSKAILAAMADTEKLPLWQYLGSFLGHSDGEILPLPNLGLWSPKEVPHNDTYVHEFSIIPAGAGSFAEALQWAQQVAHKIADGDFARGRSDEENLQMLCRAIETTGLRPHEDMGISINIAASRFAENSGYRPQRTAPAISTDLLSGQLVDWVSSYPIIAIENPFAADDPEGFTKLNWAIGKRVQIIASQPLMSVAYPVGDVSANTVGNALVFDCNPTHTVSQVRAAKETAEELSLGLVSSPGSDGLAAASGIQFAVGWGINQIQLKPLAYANHIRSWNEGLRIAETLAALDPDRLPADGNLPERSNFPWG